jgi:hypothetical protein
LWEKLRGNQWHRIGGEDSAACLRRSQERRIAAWLWRSLSALAGIIACFSLFVIPLITEGFRLITGRKPDHCRFDALAAPFVVAAIGSWLGSNAPTYPPTKSPS